MTVNPIENWKDLQKTRTSIIRERTQEIIGVHTNGGYCTEDSGNCGTMISTTKIFQEAIAERLGK